jgi:hypothetical protein
MDNTQIDQHLWIARKELHELHEDYTPPLNLTQFNSLLYDWLECIPVEQIATEIGHGWRPLTSARNRIYRYALLQGNENCFYPIMWQTVSEAISAIPSPDAYKIPQVADSLIAPQITASYTELLRKPNHKLFVPREQLS